MHYCALGRKGEPSAPRVEHTDISLVMQVTKKTDGKSGGCGGIKIKTVLIYFILSRIFEKS